MQLEQGMLIQVSPSLIKRCKTHFHDLPCGASVIIGNNGYIWLKPRADNMVMPFRITVQFRRYSITRVLTRNK